MVNRLPATRHATREELTMQRALRLPCPARVRIVALPKAACGLYHMGVPAPGSRMKPLVEGRQVPRGPQV